MTSPITSADNLIDGKLISSEVLTSSVSPANGTVLGTFSEATPTSSQEAIAAARRAFDELDWSRDRRQRHRALTALADEIDRHSETLVAMLARENGKTAGEAGFELSLTAPKLRYYAALALTESGRAAEVSPGIHMSSVPEAVGVVGIITPWNSPVVLSVRSLAPALAAGCTAVVKMPGQTGLVNGLLHEIIQSVAAIPAGVVNSLTESGDHLARLLVESPDVDAISYTGSTRVGRQILATGAKTLKRVSLELGGKTPMIVLDDADLDAAVPVLVKAITTFSGQFCMTGSRILAQRSVAAELRTRLIEALTAVRIGPGEDPASDMGPMIDAANAERVHREVEAASAYATVLVRGGVRPGTAYYEPSLLEVDDPGKPIVQEETFGPVATFEVFDTDDDAVRWANSTDYGLAASIWSRDIDRPRRIGRALRAGTVWTNTWALVADQFEEGGFKQSGVGRLNGLRGLEEFQEYKTYVQVTG
ncbi:aldehyde dehydrogenase family protein [Mycolicibacterium baixiangningiae]|uniref:aldehyde dehydrogenase family protein n=1 Tax=Mycolicibacterium baixiangningiae TaxID=2761578 RepID=UPI0018667093|nr:aldehyde dehydrogenase family protein [Mycolicibacterium baixiangningiae]